MTSHTQRSPSSSGAQGDRAADGATKSKRFRLALLGKTVVGMLIVGLAPLALLGGITLKQQRDQIRSNAELGMQSTAERLSAQVDDWVDKNVRVLQAAARLPAVQSMQQARQMEVLGAIQQAYPWMYLVFTISGDGRNVARSDGKPPDDYTDRQYYKDVMAKGKDLSWQTLLGKTSKKAALVIAVPIKEGGRVVGVLASAMTIEDISRLVATWKAGKSGYAFLVDENAKVVAHPREEFIATPTYMNENRLVEAYRSDKNQRLISFLENGRQVLGYVQGTKLHWALAVQQDEAEVFAPLRATVLLGFALLLGAAALVALSAVFASRLLIQPIVKMTHAADRMSMGELDEKISSARDDEIGLLAQSLERLRKSLKAAFTRLGVAR